MAFFKVGDHPTIRVDLKEGYYDSENGYSDYATDDMCRLAGKRVTISQVKEYGYSIAELPCNWTDEMFEDYIRFGFVEEPSCADLEGFLL